MSAKPATQKAAAPSAPKTAAPAAQKTAAAAAKNDKKPLFTTKEVADRLAACKAAASEGDKTWYKPALKFQWASNHKGNMGTVWVPVLFNNGTIESRLIVKAMGEKQCGMIMPDSDAAIAALVAASKDKNRVFKKREEASARMTFSKYNARVELEADEITIKKDADGNPILPPDSTRSQYYRMAELLSEAFEFEVDARIGDKTIIDGSKKGAKPVKGSIVSANMKVASLVQTMISAKSGKNAGAELPNPMARVKLDFDKSTGLPNGVKFFDKSKPYMVGKQQQFEEGKVLNRKGNEESYEPISSSNVHRFVLTRSSVDAIINLDTVCFSSMGISMPSKAAIVALQHPAASNVTIDDLYGDDGIGAPSEAEVESKGDDEAKHEKPALADKVDAAAKPKASDTKPKSKAVPEAKVAMAPKDEADVDGLLNDLDGDG